MNKKSIITKIISSFVLCSALTGCVNSNASITIEGLEDTYYAEYGEMYVIPTPTVSGTDLEATYVVTDELGNEVFDAVFGSFYPEIGDYTITYSVSDISKEVSLICRDTLGPTVEFYDYQKIAFEGDNITIPSFVASDVSGVNNDGNLKIYKDEERKQELVVASDDKYFTAEEGVEGYYFVYTVSDKNNNVTEKVLVTEVRKQFTDHNIEDNVIFDFDEEDYINLVSEPTVNATTLPKYSIVNDEISGITGGAIKLTGEEKGKYYGVNFIRGNTINSGECYNINLRVYADKDIPSITLESKKETLAPVSFGSINKGEWKILKLSSHQLSPDNIDINSLEIRFRVEETTNLYIDEIRGVTLSKDENLAKNYIADFDEEFYLNNIEQAGYEIGNGQITAEYSIVQKENMPEAAKEGTKGGALRVKVNDVWVADYAGFGVLGDGFKYNLEESFNTEELKEGGVLSLKIFCETGNAMALSFTYKNPVTGKLLRSKARWVRGIEGEWVTIKIDYQLITQIVPLSPISKKEGGVYEDFDITAIVLTTCGNLPIDEADMKKGFRDPCMLFYVDSMKLTRGNFVDENLEKGILADFDEEEYEDQINQAWTYVAVNADIELRPAGSSNLPEGTKGGAVWVKAHYIDDVVYPNQGAIGDGVRYYLPEPIAAEDLQEASYRIYAVTGTALYIAYVVMDKDGNRVQRQGFWETAANGEGAWSTVVQNKDRLNTRLQGGDKIIAIMVYARGDGLNGLTPMSEFYLDEIGAKLTGEAIYWKNTEVHQNTEGWPGSTTGGATINVLSYADRETKNLLGMFPYSGAGSIKVPNFLAGLQEGDSILEVVSRCSTSVSYCDGAKLSYSTGLTFNDNTKLEVEFYSTATTHGGYCFYIKDSAGNHYDWRIQNTAYSAYAWTKVLLDISTLTSAGLTDIKTIDLVAVGTTQDPNLTCTYIAYKTIQLSK